MPQKQLPLDKLAWLWAETKEPQDVTYDDIKTAYHLSIKTCPKTCKRNCKGNPFCLRGLGEGRWFVDRDDSAWCGEDNLKCESRGEGDFVGLKNLGATCYMNTFLQVWYSNLEFRTATYGWRHEGETAGKGDGESPIDDAAEGLEPTPPDTILGQLQLTFARLQFSKQKSIDPKSFIDVLGLNVDLQQDAQEFSKLLMFMLEDDPILGPFVRCQFRGEYDYVTRCSLCKRISLRPSTFYELDLNVKDRSDLHQCIEDFLGEEYLTGDNRYECPECNSKQEAVRKIRLRSLPPVLNVQLLRFVFDRKSGTKKKLNTAIQFPETLDMSRYLEKPMGSACYELSAVLIHGGPSAYSGHYVAHIRDPRSQGWYKFNDELAEKMPSGKSLQLGSEEGNGAEPGLSALTAEKGAISKKEKFAKGSHSTKHAYMLVYRRKPDQTDLPQPAEPVLTELPMDIQKLVQSENRRHEIRATQLQEMRNLRIESGRRREAEMRSIFSLLETNLDSPFEWITTDWLVKWLAAESNPEVSPISNADLRCPHGLLDVEQVSKAKCVSADGALILYELHGGGPHFTSASLCRQCVTSRCQAIRFQARVADDAKFIMASLKQEADPNDSFWVGKKSLLKWRQIALQSIKMATSNDCDKKASSTSHNWEDGDKIGDNEGDKEGLSGVQETETGGEEMTTEGNGGEIETQPSCAGEPCQPSDCSSKPATADCTDDGCPGLNGDVVMRFNTDLLCERHGNLSPDDSCRRLVSGDIWRRLRTYFAFAPEFKAFSTTECDLCRKFDDIERQKKEEDRLVAARQKQALLNLYHDRQRPTWGDDTTLYVVPTHFVHSWRAFIKDPLNEDPLTDVGVSGLICPHSSFPYEPSDICENYANSSASLTFITGEEWFTLSDLGFNIDASVTIRRVVVNGHLPNYIATPEVCRECVENRQILSEALSINGRYDNAVIFIRRLADEEDDVTLGSALADLTTAVSLRDEDCEGDEGATKSDEEYGCKLNSGKRKLLDDGGSATLALKALKRDGAIDSVGAAMALRRSGRHRKEKGEQRVEVKSEQTLRDLKLQVLKQFTVMPSDQHLILNGVELSGDCRSLWDLGVQPQSVIYLKVDPPVSDVVYIEDATKVSCPEQGFAGTGLMRRSCAV